MTALQHPCKCGSDKVSMVPAGGGRGTNDSLFYTGQCSSCGFTMEHLPENSDGRRASAIRDWNREIKGGTGRVRPPAPKVGMVSESGRKTAVPKEYRSSTPDLLRTLARVCAGKLDAAGQNLLLDAAAEIEGSEEAYAILVEEIRTLREKLTHTERNLRATISTYTKIS